MRSPALALGFALVLASGCLTDPPPAGDVADPGNEPVVFEAVEFTTDLGAFTVILYPESAPETVANVRRLVDAGYYVNREFVRAIPGHVIQVTDRAAGVTDDATRVPLEIHPDYHFAAGAAGIARAADPDSGGPQFFVMDFATSHLDGNYTVWGQVVEGLDVVHRAARVDAVTTRDYPVLNMTTDQMAIQPARITAAFLTTIELDAEEASRYPLRVAQNVRVGDYRHSLEWPKDLAAGKESLLAWYVRTYNGTAPPAPGDLAVVVDGVALGVREDPDAAGAYVFAWTPATRGWVDASLTEKGRPLATLRVHVR